MQIKDITQPGAYHVQLRDRAYLLEVWTGKDAVLWGELSELRTLGDTARVVSTDLYKCGQLDAFEGVVLQTLQEFKP